MALIKLFKSGIAMPERNAKELEASLQSGKSFFKRFNESRMKLAFEAFTDDMKKALFEIIYFLHVNDPKFQEVKYKAFKVERLSGITRESTYQATTNLYQPGFLHGVTGIDRLPETFRNEFKAYVKREFGLLPSKNMVPGFAPIVNISSLGSIGTIGHKPQKSDLDLQILYELQPFKYNLEHWTDERLKQALNREIESWIQRLCIQKKLIPKLITKQPKVYKELRQKAVFRVGKTYPYLYQILFQNKDVSSMLVSPQGRQLKMNLIHEMIQLVSYAESQEGQKEREEEEQKLKERILVIQDYIQSKFPKAEVYLFACSCESFRRGNHGTTLESKEASGSAYELVLNYEVLIPGIQFAPTIPTHFIISKQFNNSQAFYERITNYIRFRCLPLYQRIDDYVADIGATPTMKMSYILSHVGAAYWESFKAASGNLPKAILNLFRIEMLHHERYLHTIIEIIKMPELVNKVIPSNPEAFPGAAKSKGKKGFGLSLKEVLQLEKDMPLLEIDPWWLKYKILKVFYNDSAIKLEDSERRLIYRTIDLCFALHVKLSHAFDITKPKTHRERFLVEFLKRAFPKNSLQRITMERIFMGEVQTINHFEQELKDLFSNCMDRIHRIIASNDIPDGSNQSEFEIWYHFYQQNFENAPNEIHKNILSHLKVPRAKIRVRYEKTRRRGNWVFHAGAISEQNGNASNDALQGIPQEIDLTYDMSFLRGLAHCILNGYYGLLRAGTLRETKTKVEVDIGASDLGNMIDNHWSIVDSDTATRLADRIVSFFPYRKTHYMDCIRMERQVQEVYFFMNLFKFGRLSILYRDNLQSWFVDEYDHPDFVLNAQEFYDRHYSLLQHPDLHASIDEFLGDTRINLMDKQLKTSFWYNFMSTGHAQALDNKDRENALSWHFKDAVMKEHGSKDYT